MVVVDDVDEVDDEAPLGAVVLVDEEFDPATVVVVDSVGTCVLVVGNNVVGGRIVSPGGTVLTMVSGVSSAACRLGVPLPAHAATSSPNAATIARPRTAVPLRDPNQ